jgi:hypothetical protein
LPYSQKPATFLCSKLGDSNQILLHVPLCVHIILSMRRFPRMHFPCRFLEPNICAGLRDLPRLGCLPDRTSILMPISVRACWREEGGECR